MTEVEIAAKIARVGSTAMPNDYLTRAHAQIASGQSKENSELDSVLVSPSAQSYR